MYLVCKNIYLSAYYSSLFSVVHDYAPLIIILHAALVIDWNIIITDHLAFDYLNGFLDPEM